MVYDCLNSILGRKLCLLQTIMISGVYEKRGLMGVWSGKELSSSSVVQYKRDKTSNVLQKISQKLDTPVLCMK